MSLSVGTQLGSFEITGQLGAGGMGEVWRATDTKLGREVAIKTLPAALAEDADRLARFEREAQLLAALNHAHIAAVHSLDETDGTLYIVMELVEGQSLERRLESGPIALDEALQYGLQIASALEAAHEKGVVHRDLKPANIMITPDGVIKVLDFGLAKAFTSDPAERSAVHSPALSVAMTQAGIVLGTAGYMSPEQASGQPTDQRADVWAFGVVMYEMLTGQALFTGESVPHILADVLKTTPDWKRLPEQLHPRLRQMLERCLTKRPRDRYAGIADARVDIEAALRDPEGTAAGLGGDGSAGQAQAAGRRAWPIAAAFVIGVAAAGLSAWIVLRPAPAALSQFDITPDHDFAVHSNSGSFAVAPDGRSIAYFSMPTAGGGLGGTQLSIRRLDQLDSSVVMDLATGGQTELSAQAFSPFFSPDNTQIGYYMGGTLAMRRVSVQGGAPSTITDLPGPMRGASWGDDGTIVFAAGDAETGLWRVRATGGEPEQLTTPDVSAGEIDHFWPEMLPGSEAVLFSIVRASEDESEIAVLSLVTGEQRVLVQGGTTPRYSRSGHLLYGRAGTLFAVPFDAGSLEIRGNAVPVRENVATKGNLGATEFSISADGTLLFLNSRQEGTTGRRLLWVDSAGRETAIPTPPRLYDQVVLAPSERQAAVRLEADPSVWIADLERGTLQRLTEDETLVDTIVLAFSEDGEQIVYSASRNDGRVEIVSRSIDGSGQREVLASVGESMDTVRALEYSPDGARMLLTGVQNPQGFDVGMVDMNAADSYQDLISSPSAEYGARFRANGPWIAFGSDESGTFEVYVQRFPDGSGRLPVTIGGGILPFWTADGQYLTYLRPAGTAGPAAMVRLPVSGVDDAAGSPSFGSPEVLFPWTYYFQLDPRSQYDMTADGERFIVISGGTTGNTQDGRMILVQNWAAELERLAPAE